MLKKLLMSVAVSTALVAGMSAQAADKPLKIGAIMPMTGALAAYGETSLKGAELAVEEINEAGGVLGMPIELAVEDAQTEPQAGVAAANKLANIDGVAAFVGALSSGVTIPIATSVARPNKIPMISPASTSPVLTTLNDDGFLFCTVASDAIQGVAMAQVARDRGIDKVGIIYVNNDYGKGLAESFTDAFDKLGGNVTHTVAYEPKQASYRAAIQKAWGDGSTPYMLLIAYVADGETVLRQSLEGGMFNKFIFTDGMKS
ncbi:MAG TPA: ABC transporter substrate-binding protein, partial [Salinisphaeraceae bacterium]|nr:ABC transporter substrate-binding protein [Salinisphaeraceae bacterium]